MVRSVVSVTAAILVLIPVIGFSQQEVSGTSESVSPGSRPSPEALAVREGVASALDQAVASPQSIPSPPSGTWGIISEGTGGGGIFRDSDPDAEAWLGANGTGVTGYGSTSGGFFQSSKMSGFARLGAGDWGLGAGGNFTGGYFADGDGSGFAWLGYDRPSGNDGGGVANAGEYGVYAGGDTAGGYFEDSNNSGYAYLGDAHRGIRAYGSFAGGVFGDSDGSGRAWAAYDRPSGNNDAGGDPNGGEYGVYAVGNKAGGYFEDSGGSGYAYVGNGDLGIYGKGNTAGGVFRDENGSGLAYVGYGDLGIQGVGDEAGGYFEVWDVSGYARVGVPGRGIEGHGTEMGGYFADSDADDVGFAYLGYGGRGIEAYGSPSAGYFEYSGPGISYAIAGGMASGIVGVGVDQGGRFEDSTSGSEARVGHDTYKISGWGSVSFVQNHPYDPASVIVYAAPEGDEVATYTRGTARLSGGEATVPLGETFRWVTNPDIGLTAHLTPRGEPIPLAVVALSPDEMTVRGGEGTPEGLVFDYVVYGLRIGFEESSVVQEKGMEAYIPSMVSHRQLYQRRPDLRRYNSLERFKAMRHAIGEKNALDLSRAQALRDAIIEFDPAVHELQIPVMEKLPNPGRVGDEDALAREVSREQFRTARPDHASRRAPSSADLGAAIPVDDEGNVSAPAFRPSSREVAILMDVSESVKPGDVLVIDQASPGMMRRGFEGHDTGVIGVVSESAGVVLDSQSPALSGQEAEGGTVFHAEVAMAGVVTCKVDATYGAIWPGNLLVTSPTSGHAMRTESPLPGTIVGKALEPLEEGVGTIRVLVMLQ